MGIVWPCRLAVEEYAAAGRAVAAPRLRCPGCRRRLIFWSGYLLVGLRAVRPPRRRQPADLGTPCDAKCRACGISHALLPAFLLWRRLDPISRNWHRGDPHGGRPELGERLPSLAVPHSTTRDWRRRHRARAPDVLAGAEALVVELGGELPKWPADIEHAAVVTAWRRAAARAAGDTPGLWQFLSTVSGGCWLSTTTSPSWAGGPRRPLMRIDPETAALFRYTVVAEAANPRLRPAERGHLVRALAERTHRHPDGSLVRIIRGTLDRWLRAYRAHGLEGLRPQKRSDDGAARRHPELFERAAALRRELPAALRVAACDGGSTADVSVGYVSSTASTASGSGAGGAWAAGGC